MGDLRRAILWAAIDNAVAELRAMEGGAPAVVDLAPEPLSTSDFVLTPQQVAGRLCISEGQARRRMKRSAVHFYRGGRLYVRAADLPTLSGRGRE